MEDGVTTTDCIPLQRNDTIDIIEYINLVERDAREYLRDVYYKGKRDGYYKIYSLDCEASYIKIFALVFALFGLLF